MIGMKLRDLFELECLDFTGKNVFLQGYTVNQPMRMLRVDIA
jgi:hypothetical protein